MHDLLAPSLTLAFLLAPPAAQTDAASCTTEFRPAAIVKAVAAEMRAAARAQRLTGTLVRVHLSDSGRVLGASVARSSGNLNLDRAAIVAVRSQTYAPEIKDCHPLAGSYGVEVEFAD